MTKKIAILKKIDAYRKLAEAVKKYEKTIDPNVHQMTGKPAIIIK